MLEDAEKQYLSKQTFNDDGLAITMTKFRAMGLTLEHLQPWIDDPTSLMLVMNNRLERFE